MIEKAEIRKCAQANYRDYLTGHGSYAMQALVQIVTGLPAWQKAQCVALTLSQTGELPTQLLIETALLQGKDVFLPRVAPKRQLEFIPINQDTTYERHPYGMLEPVGTPLSEVEQLDFVLVPGLAYSQAGDRVGFGGGYYDRFLIRVPNAATVGVTLPANYYPTPIWPVEVCDYRVQTVRLLKGVQQQDDENS